MSNFNYAEQLRSNQREKDRADQVKNNAGGFVFKLSPIKQLERFLIIGSDGPTYYQNARELTRENAKVVQACWSTIPKETLSMVVSVAKEGRAIKRDPVLFTLAMGTLDPNVVTRQSVYAAIFDVCRTASDMFMFLEFLAKLGKGWGRGLKRAIQSWYIREGKPLDALGYQMIKYRQRNGFDHRRLLDLSHPKPMDTRNNNLFKFVLSQYGRLDHEGNPITFETELLPDIVRMYLDVIEHANSFHSELPWEAYPTERIPWTALAPAMPFTALVRNLNKFDLKPLGELESLLVKRLEGEKPNMHPFNILMAWKTYASGRGFRGSSTWTPNQRIIRALEAAFYNSFKYVEPSNERYFVAMDISGSMSATFQNSNISCRVASMAMALSILKTEPRCYVRGFSEGRAGRLFRERDASSKISFPGLVDVPISSSHTLDAAIGNIPYWSGGGTDCALPMLEATHNKLEVDKFIVFTDNETWVGKIHPYKALQEYRSRMGINAKLIVCGMTSTGFTIADPSDEGMLDIVGCDSALPQLISSL